MRTLKSVVVFLMLLVAGSVMTLSAQTRTISGKVFDSNDEPLNGVTVAVESATIGAIIDIDGAVTTHVPAGKVVLNDPYTSFAFTTDSVSLDQARVNVHLSEDADMLT